MRVVLSEIPDTIAFFFLRGKRRSCASLSVMNEDEDPGSIKALAIVRGIGSNLKLGGARMYEYLIS